MKTDILLKLTMHGGYGNNDSIYGGCNSIFNYIVSANILDSLKSMGDSYSYCIEIHKENCLSIMNDVEIIKYQQSNKQGVFEMDIFITNNGKTTSTHKIGTHDNILSFLQNIHTIFQEADSIKITHKKDTEVL